MTDLLAAIHAKWAASSATLAGIVGGLHTAEIPKGTVMPYGRLSDVGSRLLDRVFCRDLYLGYPILQFSIFGNELHAAGLLIKALCGVYDNVSLTLTDGTLLGFNRQAEPQFLSEMRTDNTPRPVYHWWVRYLITVQRSF